MSDFKGKFLNFNIGHLVTIVVYIVFAAFYVGMINRQLSDQSKAMENLESEIKEIKESYFKIVTSGSVVDQNQSIAIQSAELRITRLESGLSKLDILSSNFEWLKQWVLEKNKEKNPQ